MSLCSLLETVLGPLWVFLIYNEKPGPFTLAGGLLLIGALFVHELLAAREAVQRHERERLCGNQPVCRVHSYFSTMTRLCWLRRAVRNRHRHAVEQASRRWRGGHDWAVGGGAPRHLISTQNSTTGPAQRFDRV